MQKKMLSVRKCTEQDISAIAQLEKDTFSDAWSQSGILETYSQAQAFIVVAEQADTIVGYCILYYVLDEGEIARIAVDQKCRRQGAGRAILEKVQCLCHEIGVSKLMLDVRESNSAARSFYQKLGFEEDGIRRNFYEMPREHAVLMSMEIGNELVD